MQLTKPIFPNFAIFIKEKWVKNWCWGKSEILWRNFFNSWQVGNQSLHQTGFAWRPASKKYAEKAEYAKQCAKKYAKNAEKDAQYAKTYAQHAKLQISMQQCKKKC